jgi:UDP-2,3-diacylglucosamine hydrolase
MFSRRSNFADYEQAILTVAKGADVFIFNGDTFDFRWTTLPDVGATVVEAVRWLEELTATCPKCHFHFILGNHDNVKRFIEALDRLASRTDNLSWHPYYLKVGSHVFLHGDVTNKRKMTAADLERFRDEWLHDEKRHPFLHLVYDLVIYLGLHRAAQIARYPRKRVARRVSHYLNDVGLGSRNGTKHVYFGHTHWAMSNFEYGDLVFHNAGSPMRGLEFNILKVEIEG